MEITAEALAAHNARRADPCGNDAYNHAHKLGTHIERFYLKRAAEWHSTKGNRDRKLTRAEVTQYFKFNPVRQSA